jgi:hypothetical protein
MSSSKSEKEVKTPTLKIQVITSGEVHLETKNPKEAFKKANELQQNNREEIQIVNHIAQTLTVFKKGRYDKNYRVTKGTYSTLKQEPILAEEEVK